MERPSGWAREGPHTAVVWNKPDKQRGHERRHAGFNDRWDGMRKAEQQAKGANRRSVWTIATQPYSGSHFTTFPEKLAELCILAGSREGDYVLDPFVGSGTTVQVARRHNRIGVGSDLAYQELARRRISGVQRRLVAM